jgi:hypothetical protein
VLDLDAIANAPVVTEPFPFFTARNVLGTRNLAAIDRDFPDIVKPGIFPLSELTFGASFRALVDEIEGSELEAVIGEKFQIELSDKPLMVTVRGYCRARDGRIHNDSKDKVVTCLLYLNLDGWSEDGGRLRFLYDDHDLENLIAEVPPLGGTFAAFRRTDKSWHGHASYEGPRRYIMFNWMASEKILAKNLGRHRISAAFKRLGLFDDDY